MTLSTRIFLAIFLGVAYGFHAQAYQGGTTYVSFVGEIFKALLLMIIAPLVFSSIVMGVAGIGDLSRLRGLGRRTLAYYIATTLLAVLLGLVLVNLVKPGAGGGGQAMLARMELERNGDRDLMERAFNEKLSGGTAWSFALFEIYLERYHPEGPRGLDPTASSRAATRAEELFRTSDREREGPPSSDAAIPRLERARRAIAEIARDRPGLLDEPSLVKVRKDAGIWWMKELDYYRPPQTIGAFLHAQIDKVFRNPFDALANNDVLAIIFFSLLLGFFLVKIGEPARPVGEFIRALNTLMMAITGFIMELAPYGVFALMADAVASMGVQALKLLAWYMATVAGGVIFHGLVVLPLILFAITGMSPVSFFRKFQAPLGIAFSTSSSSATLPVTLETVTRELGVRDETAEFVIPLGATVNMDGTALYESVAAMFIAQLFGYQLGVEQQLLIFLTATLAAIGAAGIPSAGTVTMVMVLNAVGLPVEGIALILAVDRPLDALRTTCNVIGDGIGAVVIDHLEKRKGPQPTVGPGSP